VRTPGCPERGELVVHLRARVGHIEVEGPGARDTALVCDDMTEPAAA